MIKKPVCSLDENQGLPIHTGPGMADLRALEVAPYARVGGKAAFIQLHGMQGITGGYIGEIAPGGALNPERHLYEEVICILNGQGGMHPYTDGHEDKVIDIKWGEASIYCPPGDWFHQHFNPGNEPARHLAVRYGSRIHPLGFKVSHQKTDDDVFRSVDEGGWLIPYEQEDAEIPKRYNAALKANGVVV